ncbi:hypothetical protein PR202_ga07003 [Eleusine coracana subsp. coracana]|uniref:Uncharacterized protein n=1 Tax=Eleusine coracana subsp. coracana TaxID=191504 RepID=A0AAV5BYT2_ELECO|nr:hypothetical protein PR202_ga07003 [Eleusine coracana subsp. coracana]
MDFSTLMDSLLVTELYDGYIKVALSTGYVKMSNGSAPLLNIFRSLQNNRISGQIPPEIGKLTNLNALDLSGNQFVGDIPSSLGQLTRLNYLRLDRNNLSGQIPVDVAKLPGLTFLYVFFDICILSFHTSNLYIIPLALKLTRVLCFSDLSFNNLSGPVPKIYAHDYSLAREQVPLQFVSYTRLLRPDK